MSLLEAGLRAFADETERFAQVPSGRQAQEVLANQLVVMTIAGMIDPAAAEELFLQQQKQ